MSGALNPPNNYSISMYSADDEEGRADAVSPDSEAFFTPSTSTPMRTLSGPSPQAGNSATAPIQHSPVQDSVTPTSVTLVPERRGSKVSSPPLRSRTSNAADEFGYANLAMSPYGSPSALKERHANTMFSTEERALSMLNILKVGEGLKADDEEAPDEGANEQKNRMRRSGNRAEAEEPVLGQKDGTKWHIREDAVVEDAETQARPEEIDREWLRAEMRALRQEFVVLREAVLASRG
jgi:hypothetical protein